MLRCATRRGVPELNHDDPSTFSPPAAFGPFRVLHQIGSGVLGPVFRTYEPERDRLIAVKAFRIDLLPEQSALLATELQRIVDAGLSHPAIVQPLAAGMEGHLPYLAQEYVAAESLDIAMKHYAPAVPARVLPFLEALAGAIDAAAAAGMLHGALHPRDVFVTTDEARATGFGIVQAIENIGFRAPTRRPYTAPERVNGDEWGIQADVFSLAAIAHELLTGRRPAGPGDQDGSFAPDVPAEHRARLRDVLARALAEDPADRHESAGAFVTALRAAAEGQAVTPPPARSVSAGTTAVSTAAAAAAPGLFDAEDEPDTDGAAGPDGPDEEAVETIDDIEDESDIEGTDDVDTQPSEPAEPAEPDVWPPPGFSADDPDVIAERETDEVLADFDLDLNRIEPEATPVAPSALAFDEPGADYETATEEDETSPFDAGTPDEPIVAPPVPLAAPAAAPAGVAAWQPTAAAAPAPDTGRALRPLLWLLGGIGIGFLLAWFWLGGDRAIEQAAEQPAQEEAVTEEPLATPAEPVTTAPATVPVPPADTQPPSEPAAPAAAAPASGRLLVRSTPTNAMVVIDGVWSGRTPFTKTDMTFGRHTVRVVLEGYVPINRTVTFSPEAPAQQMTFELVRARRAPDQ